MRFNVIKDVNLDQIAEDLIESEQGDIRSLELLDILIRKLELMKMNNPALEVTFVCGKNEREMSLDRISRLRIIRGFDPREAN